LSAVITAEFAGSVKTVLDAELGGAIQFEEGLVGTRRARVEFARMC